MDLNSRASIDGAPIVEPSGYQYQVHPNHRPLWQLAERAAAPRTWIDVSKSDKPFEEHQELAEQ